MYNPIAADQLGTLDDSFIKKGEMVLAFIKGENKLAFTRIFDMHKQLAANEKDLKEYWKDEGVSKEDLAEFTSNPDVNFRAGKYLDMKLYRKHIQNL